MKFKIGDKIKVVGNVFWVDKYYTGRIGVITKVEAGVVYSFPYIIRIEAVTIPVYEHEIEKVSVKGEQLLFEFMV